MDPRRAAGEGDVEAIVHEHARRAALCERHHLPHEVHERRRVKVPFADLQVIDAGINGLTRLLEEASPDSDRVP